MSAKWRALQHRHRFTYTAVVFPPYYIEALNLLPSHVSSLNFFIELKELISLNSIHAQVNHVKKVTSNFGELLSNGEDGVVSMAVRFYLEILFLENSLPLHRNLVSVLAKRHKFQSVISGCLQSMCDEYGVVGGKGKRFSVSRAVLSLLSSPKLGFLVETIEECAISVALDIIFGLNAALSETNGGSRPSPVVMEQIQEALSCLYYLLQRFPSKFGVMDVSQSDLITENSNIFEMVVRTILSILKSSAFSRDCLIAAGVSFCAALQVCLSPQELPFFIIKSLFYHTTHGSIISCESEFRDVSFKLQYKGDVYSEIMGFSLWSRIYLLRGILTAVPRAVLNTHFNLEGDGSNDFNVHGFTSNPEWTILFDGILPELCNYCENPIDSHFNFHVLTVMQICLQQIKTSILDKVVNLSGNYDPLPEEMGSRISRIIWNNLEDPLNQTVKQVHLLFDLFLDIQSSLLSGKGTEKFKSILWKNASDLLRLGARCKGRYVPLGSLTKRLGAKTILDMSPKLLFQTIQAYIDDDVCCAATSFLKCFIECLRDECWSSDGVEKGYVTYRGHCLPPILYGLVSGVSKLRSNLNTYALPVVLELDVDSIFPMLAFISVRQSGYETELIYPELSGVSMNLSIEQQVAALVSLLKVSRLLALIEGDIDWYHDSLLLQDQCGLTTEHMDPFAVVCIKGIKLKVLAEWLVLALTHVDETLRVDAAESLFLNPKTSSLPSPLELSLMKEAVPLNMRCCSTAFQMKWTSLFRKFFFRVRTALERVYRQGCWQPLTRCDRCEVGLKGPKETVVDRAKDLFKFIKWLSCFLFFSCYPSAPYERKIMAMELILIMINVWSIVPPLEETCSSNSVAKCLYPYNKGLVLPDSTFLLVGSIIDSWDRLRESSFRILLHFPTPLPGISSQDMVKEVVMWAKKLVCSPRVRESDAGALTLRLIFRKYVLELGWMVRASVNVVCFQSHSELINGDSEICKSKFPIMEYILSLMDWLHVLVKEGEKDLSEACSNSFVHGALLTLRYTFEELDWNSDVVLSSTSDMRHALEKLLELVMRITSLALWVVSADAWYLPVDMDDMVEDDSLLLDVSIDMDVPESSSELQAKDLKPAEDHRPSEQVVMVGCWLAMKEVSLLLGTIIRKIPLPGCSASPASKPGKPFCEAAEIPPVEEPDVMLDLKQLENIGNHFLEVLLKMKHNGAIDKTRAGFTALCNRLLCSNDPRLCKMTEYWMELLMERTVAKGQTVDDLLRRSAGIPAAFIAFFLSEPEGAPKKLLPQALRWLIDVANKSLMNRTETNSQHGVTWGNLSTKLNQESVSSVPTEMGMNKSSSKSRDEGVIPTVHAFNVLRAAFNDTNLATDTSGFAAEALIVSIRSFSSPYWEVRNSACLAYTALVRRMIGFLNVQKRESVRRALTGLEFFHRYPTLHPFLFDELETATKFLGDGSSGHLETNIAKVVHPSLCPMLILLSRLKPSPISGVTEDALDPFLFMPFIRRCSTQNNLRVRVLASRALTGLVANEKLQTVLLNIASGLPSVKTIMIIDSMSSLLNKSSGTHVASYNSIHGMLLQLSSLLDTNCRNLGDFSKINLILGDLVQVLIKRSWIGKHRLCPCPILNGAYLQVLDCMFNIMRGCGMSKNAGSLRSLLLDLSSECLDVQVSCGHSFYDPTIADLRGQAAISYFNCVSHFQASIKADESFQILHGAPPPASDVSKLPEMRSHIPGAQERLILCIFDASYEVRLATLKWLYQSLTSNICSREACAKSGSDMDIIYTWMRTDLQPTLIKLLTLEENHRCKYYILRILFSWNLLQFQKLEDQQCEGTVFVGGMDFDSILQFWDKLILLNKVATHTKTRETLICCMGICVKRFAGLFTSLVLSGTVRKDVDSDEVDQLERSGRIYECIYFFISLIKQQSEPSEPVNMRRAASESIVASGLLEQAAYYSSFVSNTQIPCKGFSSGFEPSEAANLYARRILDLWFTCIKMLEDEDVELRQRLAMDVQKCFTLKGSERNQQNGAIPTQVEKVIESSFEFLSSIFGHWLEYFDQLSQWVLGTGSHVIARGDLVRRVFDKEIDNHHEEKLLICQICCFHLEKIPILKLQVADSSKKQGIRSFLQKWRMTFYHQLISFANDHLGMAVGVDWIGGLGNHKDAFLSVYSNLLGLYALSQCLFNGGTEIGMPQLSDLVKLEETIKPYLRNPLISNLYFLIIQVHEQTLAVSINSSGPKFRGSLAIWEGFDPYFLLNRNSI